MAEKNKISKKAKTAIVILLCLVILSSALLACRVVYLNFFKDKSITAVVPDNLIGKDPQSSKPSENNSSDSSVSKPQSGAQSQSAKAATLEIYKGKEGDSERFEVYNMLPGDSMERYFAVKISHEADVKLLFNAEVTAQTKELSKVLNIKVTSLNSGKVLYSGSFDKINSDGYSEKITKNDKKQTVAYYKIEVSLPTSTGNEYQQASLIADFKWSVENSGSLTSPDTGEGVELIIYIAILMASATTLLLFSKGRKRKENHYAEEK